MTDTARCRCCRRTLPAIDVMPEKDMRASTCWTCDALCDNHRLNNMRACAVRDALDLEWRWPR